ncbi:MAG: response regulator [Chloroflexi bacterium]|nr:response regulator [Chloroflexota bacterium]MCC6892426.1 response regulator [Anaerolineae bacterium]
MTNLLNESVMDHPNNLKKVLIVDDEDMTRVLLTHILQRMRVDGLEVLLAEDGEEAIRMANEERPGLILLDVLLPKMNGYDVCQRVRGIADYSPYVVILTARGNSNDRQRAEAIGANDFMTKPFNPARLMNQLSQIWGL